MNTIIIILTLICSEPVYSTYWDLNTNVAERMSLEDALVRAHQETGKQFKVIKLPAPQTGMCT